MVSLSIPLQPKINSRASSIAWLHRQRSQPPLMLQNNIKLRLPIGLLIVSILGFADAAYLTIEHYLKAIPPCAVGNCEQVLTSVYSQIAGVPVSLLGAIYYLLIAVLVILYLDTKNVRFFKAAAYITVLGFVASLYFFYLQAFVIHAYCQYCLMSAVTSTLLFILGIWSIVLGRTQPKRA